MINNIISGLYRFNISTQIEIYIPEFTTKLKGRERIKKDILIKILSCPIKPLSDPRSNRFWLYKKLKQ